MSRKSWADYEEPKGPTADDVNPDQFTVSGSVTAYYEEFEEKEEKVIRYYLTVENFEELIQEVLDCPAAVSDGDYDFVSSLAELDKDKPLSWKQVEWLDDIEGKIGYKRK